MSIFNLFSKQSFIAKELENSDLKSMCKIHIIDNEKPEALLKYLKNEGWHPTYSAKILSIRSKEISDSHIICIDILDVGAELGLENGLGLIKPIKKEFPEKRILVYSSKREHDFFSDCIELIDKKVIKTSSPLPFESAISELARSTLNWNDAVNYTYSKLPESIRNDFTKTQFKEVIEKNIKKKTLNIDGVVSGLKVSREIVTVAIPLLKFAMEN